MLFERFMKWQCGKERGPKCGKMGDSGCPRRWEVVEMKFGGWELICSVVRNVIEIGLIHWKRCTGNEGSTFSLSPKVWKKWVMASVAEKLHFNAMVKKCGKVWVLSDLWYSEGSLKFGEYSIRDVIVSRNLKVWLCFFFSPLSFLAKHTASQVSEIQFITSFIL